MLVEAERAIGVVGEIAAFLALEYFGLSLKFVVQRIALGRPFTDEGRRSRAGSCR
jgi:hypothetical protein